MIITDKTTIHSIVYKCYEECSRSREFYHQLDNNNTKNIAIDFINRMSKYNVKFYNYNEFYFGIIDSEIPLLWTFFIKKEYRNKNTHKLLFKTLNDIVGKYILTGCEERNKPAFNFLTKYSKKYISEIDGFLLDLEDLCLG